MNAREFPTDGIWCIPVRSPRRAGDCAHRLLSGCPPEQLRSFRGRFGCLVRPRVLVLQVSISTQGGAVATGTGSTRASRWPSLAGRRFRRSEQEAASITSVVCGTAPGFAKVGRDSAAWPGSGRIARAKPHSGDGCHTRVLSNLGQTSQSASRSDQSLNGVGHGRQREGKYASS